ncbi:MAG: bifunctional phosphopantothenoylcysteine decarboxylase/phosphopantothenate--cysteine ligase CoaBC [Coriobacteriia bacterium]|nr:bifunctional phosphopantothenoylcysteine decarboxylase/phosphopantothenate--cysteine ligase CoaBC [Coriobacteriia bacterium]
MTDGAQQKTILLGITGGIAAYKICDLVRQLVHAGHNVKVVMTEHAQEFIGAATFRSLTGNPVATELFDDPHAPINHISLAQETDIFLIAPTTANVIAKIAHGRADDLLTTTALTFQGPLLIAPAMNTQMYLDSVTQENLTTLASRGANIIGPAAGELACGTSGPGRMADIADLFTAVEEHIQTSTTLAGKKVLISAGPTHEYFDPVRYMTNRSSGKMGIALARAALHKGAEVELVAGPTAETVPVDEHLTHIDVTTAVEMHQEMLRAASDADLIICAAAVADYRPSEISPTKIKKQMWGSGQNLAQNIETYLDALSNGTADAEKPRNEIASDASSDNMRDLAISHEGKRQAEDDISEHLIVEFVPNPDILAELGQMKLDGALKNDMILVGFAAETDNIEENVRAKLDRKGADFIVANDVSRADIGFESEDNEVRIFSRAAPDADILLPQNSKVQLAEQILKIVME